MFVQIVALALGTASSTLAHCRARCASSAAGSSVKESGSSPQTDSCLICSWEESLVYPSARRKTVQNRMITRHELEESAVDEGGYGNWFDDEGEDGDADNADEWSVG